MREREIQEHLTQIKPLGVLINFLRHICHLGVCFGEVAVVWVLGVRLAH